MNIKNIIAVVAITGALIGCGGGASSTSSSSGLSDADSLTGTVFAPNGTDPVAGATIYIPSSGSTMVVKNKAPAGKTVTGSDGTTTCDDPPETACAETCSLPDGTFTLDSTACPSTATTLKIVKGSLAKTTTLDCSGTTCTLAAADTTFPSTTSAGAPTMAVVTGEWDDIEDVLAKLGFGTLGSNGRLDISQPFQFTLIDGDDTLDDTEYNNFSELLDGTIDMESFDIIFINCGAHDYEDSADLSDNDIQVRISEYMANGGKLYVTDRAYDYIEQIFPAFLKFYGDSADPNSAGAIDAAEYGSGSITADAVVNDSTMQNWLGEVTVNASTLDATVPGNPTTEYDAGSDCSGSGSYTQVTGALKTDDTIPIGDFLGNWAMIDSAHSGSGALIPTLWIDSGSGSSADFGMDNRPLTASVSYGSNGGKIAYSSYHTAHQCPTQGFWPQERILQYLIFETF
ncbi:MAG: hypothetical protein HYT75_07205 [Deltaproteobacteria bacterium]|nr:hypothetical protein [Deltaproteobacteria bacterium]MBI2342575.1 hypothetical protein [Deltaproteobacteria bacterium]